MGIVSRYLLVDIGNSTVQYLVIDEAGIGIMSAHPTRGFEMTEPLDQFACIVVSSVAPSVNHQFESPRTIFIDYKTIPQLTFSMDHPDQIGADRLVTALAGFHVAQTDCLVIDSGTATTLCRINHQANYLGGIILPGLALSAKALQLHTEKLPLVWTEPIHKSYGETTTEAIQIGLYNGHRHTLNGFITEYRDQVPQGRVIGTGTGLVVVHDQLDIDFFNETLIFDGLLLCLNAHLGYTVPITSIKFKED